MKKTASIVFSALCAALLAVGALADEIPAKKAADNRQVVTEYLNETLYENFEDPNTVPVLSDDVPDIPAASALLCEASTGTVIFEKNSAEKRPPASITKIMTMLLTVEAVESGKISLNDTVTASEHACSMGGSQIWLENGETMVLSDLLKSVAVGSANDAAVALAEYISGSEEAFAALMNKRAAELSMNDTHFVNASGLDTDGHISTAADVAKMACELLKHDIIKNYTTIWMDSVRNGKTQLVNTNKLIRFYEGATGLKTGTTDKAGYCVTASAKKNGMELVAVILDGQTSDLRFSAAKALLNYGFANYELANPDIGSEALLSVDVTGGTKRTVDLDFTKQNRLLTEKGRGGDIEVKIELEQSVAAPVEKGQVLGKAEFLLDGQVILQRELYAADTVDKKTFGFCFAAFSRQFFGL